MYVVNNFMMAIAQLVDFLLTAYMWIIIGRAVDLLGKRRSV